MKRRVDAAVRKVGGIARIPENGMTFPASIQPARDEGDGHTEIGTGRLCLFTIYTACDDTTQSLREGSRIEYRGEHYVVRSMETYCLEDKPVFRRGVIILEQEGGYGKSDGA